MADSWDSWSTSAGSKPMLLLAVNYLLETREDPSNANQHYARNRVRAEWGRPISGPGMDRDTALYQAQRFNGVNVSYYTAAANNDYLLTNGAAIENDNYILIDGFDTALESSAVRPYLLKGWHLMLDNDPTIYMVNADTFTGVDASILASGTTPRFNAIDFTNSKLYYGDAGGSYELRYADLDGSNDALVRTGTAAISGISVDPTGGKVYFAEGAKLQKCDLDGSNLATLLTAGGVVTGVSVDTTNGKVYYNYEGGGLYYCDTDGTNNAVVVANTGTGTDQFWDVQADPANSHVYFVEIGNGGRIRRCSLTGTGGVVIRGSLTTDVRYLAVDADIENIWYTLQSGGIYRMPLDGVSAGVKVQAPGAGESYHGLTLDVDNDYIYYVRQNAAGQRRTGLGGNLGAFVNVTPAITERGADGGDNTPVYFFIPQDSGGEWASHPKGYNATISEEHLQKEYLVAMPEP